MNKMENYIELPNSDVHNCFACSAKNPSGLQMKFFTDEKTVFSWITVPDHLCGYNTVVHGGVVSTILDEVMGWAALYLLEKITLTKSMTVEFIKSVYVGEPLKAEGKVIDLSGKREVLLEGTLVNEQGEICARSQGSFTLLSPKLAIRLGVMSAEGIKEFFEPLLELRRVKN
ncbi:MAG: PaaI family thioesterase [Deltaproteobacteria bacterium]|nr:PaaI family thioesterase [Deltaproteobacteria bacterium]